MRRKLLEQLILWKENTKAPPFLMMGARCVGKTYLALDFAANHYQWKAYLNTEHNPGVLRLFDGEEPGQWKERIEAQYKVDVAQKDVLLILDEIREPILFLKAQQLKREFPGAQILMISSYALRKEVAAFFNSRTLHPMDFEEFLDAMGSDWYIPTIHDHFYNQKPLPDIVHRELLRMLDRYLVVGGMPEAVLAFVQSKSVLDVPEIHKRILASLEYDLSDQLGQEGLLGKCLSVYSTMDLQMAKKNKRFQCSLIRKGTTFASYQGALDALYRFYMLYDLPSLTMDELSPRLFFTDVGMLLSMTNRRNRLKNAEQYREFADSLLQNFVMENLLEIRESLSYWESDRSARVDFVLSKGQGGLPEAEELKGSGGKSFAEKREAKDTLEHISRETAMTGIMMCKKKHQPPYQEDILQHSARVAAGADGADQTSKETEDIIGASVWEGKRRLLPIEIFMGSRTRSRTFYEFQKYYHVTKEVKLSMQNFSYGKSCIHIPIYAVCCLKDAKAVERIFQE